jgi:glycosyltransferase involved in cell wall biosynthesis
MPPATAVIVSARNEAERLGATLAALRDAFPGARIIVADDASTDRTADVARDVEVVSAPRRLGKGGAMTLAAQRIGDETVIVLCDGDLGDSARHLTALAEAVRNGDAGLVVGAFQSRVGGGFGLALSFARWAIRRRAGLDLKAPISGQRALSRPSLEAVLPFAPRFGMEIGMTIDAVRAGFTVHELELPLRHRATTRTFQGFAHRGRQLADFAAVYVSRRNRPPVDP